MSEDTLVRAAPPARLSRTLRRRHLAMISIGGTVGAGLFVGSSTSIIAGGPATFLSYLITGLVIFAVMRMLAEMGAAYPHTSAFTEFTRAGLGNGGGFVAGWLTWYVWIMTIPIEAIAGAKILQVWIPLSQLQIGVALMSVMTLINLMPTRSYAEFEFWFASIKVAAIVSFITIAALYACGWTSPSATFGNLTRYGGLAPHGWIAVLAVVPTAFFSMTGAEITGIAAAESTQQSADSVARTTTLIIGRILFFYVGSVFMIVSVTPWNLVRSGESPFTLALNTMHIPYAGSVMAFIILTAVLSCLNSAFYISSRVLFVLAEHRDAPPFLVRLNSRRVPVNSVLIAAPAGFLGLLAATQAPQAVFDFLVSSSGALMIFVYIFIALAQIQLRWRREREKQPSPAITVWLFPWLSIATILAMLSVLVAMATDHSLQSTFQASGITLGATYLAYGVVKRVRR